MSSKPDSWLPLYVADYLADTTRFSTEQHGAYLLVIMDYWRNGPPPDDDRTLAQITGLTLARWKAHRPVIASKFQISGGVWHHKRIDAEIAKAQRKSELARDAAYRRHGKTDASGDAPDDADAGADAGANAHAETDAGDHAEGMQKGCSSPSPTQEVLPEVLPSPAPKSVARTARAPAKTRLPDGFNVSDRVRQWAEGKGFSRLDEHLEHFIGKARAKGYTYADWDEGFMGAIRDDWAGLRRGDGATPLNGKPWFIAGWSQIIAKGVELGLEQDRHEGDATFRARIFHAAGVTDEMVRKAEADWKVAA